jgi:hypothetical protein
MSNTFVKPTNWNVDANLQAQYEQRDEYYWTEVEALIASQSISVRDVLRNYPAFIRRRELPRLLAHWELFKLIKDLPGSVVELGVYFGAGMFSFAKMLETFCPGDRSRKVYGFDTFDGYSGFTSNDGSAEHWVKDSIGKKRSNFELMTKLCEINNLDGFIAGVERSVIIRGDVTKTVPTFASSPNGLRISLLYFDTNLYEPTLVGLEHLYPLVVPGGVVAFNAYGIPPWEGEARAFEKYFGITGQPALKKWEYSNIPSAYFLKP